jgi:hypothetical protein
MKILLRGGIRDGVVIEFSPPDPDLDLFRGKDGKERLKEKKAYLVTYEYRPTGEIDQETGFPIWREVV